MASLSNFIKYAFDPTGAASTNTITGEVIEITSPRPVPIPLAEGMFYNGDTTPKLSITDMNTMTVLVEGTDYTLIAEDLDIFARTGVHAYAAFMLTNTNYTGTLQATYQCVGGPEGTATSFIKKLALALQDATQNLNVDWATIQNKPSTFPPSLHDQPLASLTGFEQFADVLQLLIDTIVSRIPLGASRDGILESQNRMVKMQAELMNHINEISLNANGIVDYDNLVTQINGFVTIIDTAQALPYDPNKIYQCGDVATVVVNGVVKRYEWYSNVESLAGKDPTLDANRRKGWSDNTKPFYWIEASAKIPGETLWWGSDNTPENMLVDTGQDVPVAVYWRLAQNRPDLIKATDSSLLSMPGDQGRYVRAADGSTYIAGDQHEDAIRNIVGTIGGYHPSLVPDGVFTLFSYSASHYVTTTDGTGGNGYTFDASTVVPTASENQPKTAIEWKGLAI